MVKPVRVVRPAVTADVDACVGIVRGLPEFFTPDVAGTVREDLRRHAGYVLVDGDQVAGFSVVARRSAAAAEILWAAVAAPSRGRGLGRSMIDQVLGALAADGVSVVLVKTLDRSSGYEPYDATLAFWERRGFVQVATIDPLPGWQPGNPAALYVAALHATR